MESAVDQHDVTPCAAPMQEKLVARVESIFGHTGPQSASPLLASAQQLRERHTSLLDPDGASGALSLAAWEHTVSFQTRVSATRCFHYKEA